MSIERDRQWKNQTIAALDQVLAGMREDKDRLRRIACDGVSLLSINEDEGVIRAACAFAFTVVDSESCDLTVTLQSEIPRRAKAWRWLWRPRWGGLSPAWWLLLSVSLVFSVVNLLVRALS